MEAISHSVQPVPVQNAGFVYNQLIHLVLTTTRFLFHSMEAYLPEGEDKIKIDYPCVVLGNHVSELDVPSLAFVHSFLTPSIKFAIPAREDIMKKHFLSKEFHAKGLPGLLLRIVDWTNIIPFLLTYIGATPIKRPFRDDARDLLRKGQLREQVEREWSSLLERVKAGRNMFLFPEGRYSDNGWVNQIRKGVLGIKNKFPNIQFNAFNLTYDYIAHKKPSLHVALYNSFDLQAEAEESLTQKLRNTIGQRFVITPGNYIAYSLMKIKGKTIRKGELMEKMKRTLHSFHLTYADVYIAKDLLEDQSDSVFDSLLEGAKQNGYIQESGKGIQASEKLDSNSNLIGNKLLKKNRFLYHYNQLTSHIPKLDEEWKKA